jgi:hypothetical protein
LKYIQKKEGARGMLPLGCFLLWGREGVILQGAAENKRIEIKEDFTRDQIFIFFHNGGKEISGYFLAIVIYPEWLTLVEGRVPRFDLVISRSISSWVCTSPNNPVAASITIAICSKNGV